MTALKKLLSPIKIGGMEMKMRRKAFDLEAKNEAIQNQTAS